MPTNVTLYRMTTKSLPLIRMTRSREIQTLGATMGRTSPSPSPSQNRRRSQLLRSLRRNRRLKMTTGRILKMLLER